MRTRILLISLILGAWFGLKFIDYYVPGPSILLLLCGIIVVMITHSLRLLIAQRRVNQLNQQLARSESSWKPHVSIVVSAKNEARVIEKCVRNLFKIDYPSYDVWIVDDQSTDRMPIILDRLAKEFPRLNVIHRARGSYPGKSAALNEALAACKGDVIAVFDADACVDPDFFKLTLPVLEPERVGAVQAQKRIYERQTGFLAEGQASEYALDTYFQTGRDVIGGVVELRGNGQVIKRQALIDVGGWNAKAITDDLDLSMRLLICNWDVKMCPLAVVWEEAVTTLKALMRQRRRWAEGSIRRYLDYIFPLNSPRRLSIVERLDTIIFTVFFSVPALVLLEVISEVLHLASGQPTHGKFLGAVTLIVLTIGWFNLFVALKIYRKLPTLRAIIHSAEVNCYIFAHWVPCVLVSISQIVCRRKASTWHPTEHVGHEANATLSSGN